MNRPNNRYLALRLFSLRPYGPDDGKPDDGKPDVKGDAGVTFTPEQQQKVNAIAAEERRKVEERLRTEINSLSDRAKLTEKEKGELEERIRQTSLNSQTAVERIKSEYDEYRKTAEGQIKAVKSEAENWQTRFQTEKIQTAIISAAAQAEAWNPDQVLRQLKPNAKLVPVLTADGKPTDQLEVKIELQKPGEKGPVTLSLSPSEAMKVLKELPTEANLFKSNVRQGINRPVDGQGTPSDYQSMTPDQAIAARKGAR
jgi:DNA repair exonuclease SbcCD ATPase subunit